MMSRERQSRPAEASGAAQGVDATATGAGYTTYPHPVPVQPVIRSVWRVDLRYGDARQVEYAPAGGHVVLVAPAGRYPDNSEVAWICDHARHLGSITVESSSLSVAAAWESALSYGMSAWARQVTS